LKILVTGGAGFIGSHITDSLTNLGYEVVVLDDLSGGFRENVNKKAIFVKGSTSDFQLVKELFEKYKFDYVYHLAAYAAEGLSHFIRVFNYQNNLVASVNLINESVKQNIKCFVFTSSIAVYGEGQLPFKESTIPKPEDPYGISKYAVELDLKAAHKMFGLNYIIFRPYNVYGERQNIGDKYRNVLGIFMNQIMQDKELTIFGNGTQTRAFTYVEDIAETIAKAPFVDDAVNQVFNIGSGKPYSVNELAKIIGEAFNKEVKIRYLPERNEVKHAYSSTEKIERVFGFKPKTNLRDGVRKMTEWVKKHGIKKSKDFKNVEVTNNIPPSWFEKTN